MKKQEPIIIQFTKKLLNEGKDITQSITTLLELERYTNLKEQLIKENENPALNLAYTLKKQKYFSYAKKLFKKLPELKKLSKTKRLQQLALCTYKDPDVPGSIKFDEALNYLKKIDEQEIKNSKDPETLGLAGAIYKQKWQFDGQLKNLDFSLFYYRAGYNLWRNKGKEDYGYTALNTAYLIDLLTHQEIKEREELHIPLRITKQLAEARTIRLEIIAHFDALEKTPQKEGEKPLADGKEWITSTLAEAHFGLQQYEKAKEYLINIEKNLKSWEYETTARQLASIAQIQIDFVDGEQEKINLETKARDALSVFVPNENGVDSAFKGKVGLALSGGGFRASLYHIGVLAKLAELDILRHIETLSCVSGGSILGVYYYLKVKKLFEDRTDDQITKADYIRIIKEIEEEFLQKIQTNIRMQVFANLGATLDFISEENYSRTHKLGELYEEVLYNDIFNKKIENTPIYMHQLEVQPKGEANFNIKTDNWRRRNKVPKLIINATTLNTGHNWQFTASFMGEPPGNILTEIDAKYRLRRMYYYEAPEPYNNKIRLGHAVAASSGVPGIFDPLPMKGLYPKVNLQLVDGGVHDNQGVLGLIEQECSILLVSDASGQIINQDTATTNVLKILTRTNDILMERVREGGFQQLLNRKNAGLAKEIFFVHLTKDLNLWDKNWTGFDQSEAELKLQEKEDAKPTKYGIAKPLQKLMAGIRTDLDAFNNQEAHALMFSGYKMTEKEYEEQLKSTFDPTDVNVDTSWNFSPIGNLLITSNSTIQPILETAGKKMFKVFSLYKYFKILLIISGILILSIGGSVFYIFADSLSNITIKVNIFYYLNIAGFLLLTYLVGQKFGQKTVKTLGWVKPKQKIRKRIIGSVIALFLWATAKIYLNYFNKQYLDQGKLSENKQK